MEKQARIWGIACTVIYLALFFPSFYIGMLNPHLLDNANVTTWPGLAIVFLSLLAPISIVIGIGVIWYMYFAENYVMVYVGCALPLACSMIILLLMKIIQVFFV